MLYHKYELKQRKMRKLYFDCAFTNCGCNLIFNFQVVHRNNNFYLILEIFHSIIEWLEKRENPLITCTKKWNISGLLFNFEIKLTKPPYKILNLYTFVLPMINLIFPGKLFFDKIKYWNIKTLFNFYEQSLSASFLFLW